MKKSNVNLLARFSRLESNASWAFGSNRSGDIWTHDYHRYPAKFPPQIVRKLLNSYAQPDDLIVDVFAGCGTSLVESKVNGYRSIGVDINPVANMITNAKIKPISPGILTTQTEILEKAIQSYSAKKVRPFNKHDRIDYWFDKTAQKKIAFLIELISKIKSARVQDFYLCALSHTMKNTSRWLQTGTKPQIDPNKSPQEAFMSFLTQVKKMTKLNSKFYQKLRTDRNLDKKCQIKIADARSTRIRGDSAGMVITSPPYVTSYEYADIHQLTGYWYEYISDMNSFRKKFIGTLYSGNESLYVKSEIGQDIIDNLNKVSKKYAREIAMYFNNMHDVIVELNRILRSEGKACLVIGNTTLKNVKIYNAETVSEMLKANGFRLHKIIKRKVSEKLLPTIRDKTSGRFAKIESKNSKRVYPEEYVIIAEKK